MTPEVRDKVFKLLDAEERKRGLRIISGVENVAYLAPSTHTHVSVYAAWPVRESLIKDARYRECDNYVVGDQHLSLDIHDVRDIVEVERSTSNFPPWISLYVGHRYLGIPLITDESFDTVFEAELLRSGPLRQEVARRHIGNAITRIQEVAKSADNLAKRPPVPLKDREVFELRKMKAYVVATYNLAMALDAGDRDRLRSAMVTPAQIGTLRLQAPVSQEDTADNPKVIRAFAKEASSVLYHLQQSVSRGQGPRGSASERAIEPKLQELLVSRVMDPFPGFHERMIAPAEALPDLSSNAGESADEEYML